MQRTAGYVTTLAFADTDTADHAVARVRGIHRKVRGIDPVTGAAYSADDPDLLGATGLPSNQAEVDAYFAAVRPELVASPVAMRAARRLAFAPLPRRVEFLTPARPAWTAVAAVAIGMLPGWAKELYGLPRIPR